MDQRLQECLNHKQTDYILPFLWLHGESHEELSYFTKVFKKPRGCSPSQYRKKKEKANNA